MQKIEYPKWKYHADKPAVIVESEAQEAALGHGWVNSPAETRKSSDAATEGAPVGNVEVVAAPVVETPKAPAAETPMAAPVEMPKRKRGKKA